MRSLLIALTIFSVLVVSGALAYAQDDVQGADDEAQQKDLNGQDDNSTAGVWDFDIYFDDTGWTGGNTGDACLLFDTDSDGLVNAALCGTVSGDPATFDSYNFYYCEDDKPLNCTNATTTVPGGVTPPTGATCNDVANSDGTDPFAAEPGHDVNKCKGTDCTNDDTRMGCSVNKDGILASADLIDICAYPSQSPNSRPSDCITAATGPTAIVLKALGAGSAGGPSLGLMLTVVVGLVLASGAALATRRSSETSNEVMSDQ